MTPKQLIICQESLRILKQEEMTRCKEYGIGCYSCDYWHMVDMLESHLSFSEED